MIKTKRPIDLRRHFYVALRGIISSEFVSIVPFSNGQVSACRNPGIKYKENKSFVKESFEWICMWQYVTS